MADNYVSLTKQDPFYEGIKRRQKYAEMLAKQGAEDIKVEDVGGTPTPISPFQGLAKVFQTGLGAYLGNEADKEEAANLDARREKVAKALSGMPNATKATAPTAPPTDATGAVAAGATPATPARVTFNQTRDYLTGLANSSDPDIAEAGTKRLKTFIESTSQMAKVNPSQYTTGSVKNYMDTGDYSDLVAKPTGLKGDLYDMFDVMGLDVKNIATNPLAQEIISGVLAKKAGLITQADAADLALKFVNAGVTRATELRQNPTGTDVPPMPGQAPAFSIKPYLKDSNATQPTSGGDYTLGRPALTAPPVYTLPPQPQAQTPASPRPPMGQAAPAPAPQQQGGAPMFAWQKQGFVPLVVDPTISPMERQKLKLDQPTAAKTAITSMNTLDNYINTAETLKNHPGLELVSGQVGSRLPNISKEATQATALYDQMKNIAAGLSLQNMKDQSKTGSSGLGQITMGEYPILRSLAANFVNANTKDAQKVALANFQNKAIQIRNAELDYYNKTYPSLNYRPPAYAPFGGIKAPRNDAQNQEIQNLANMYRKGK
jgi:hypothetical protein